MGYVDTVESAESLEECVRLCINSGLLYRRPCTSIMFFHEVLR